MKFKHIPIYLLVTKSDIRKEPDTELADLCASIELYDVLQPIVVTPNGKKFNVVAGHRRLEATKALNEPTIPCVIRDDISDKDRPFIQLVENSQRRQLTAAEYVEAFDDLMKADPSWTKAKIARALGRSPQWVVNHYQALRYAGELLSDGIPERDVQNMTTGQIIKRVVERRKELPDASRVKDIKIKRSSRTSFFVTCADEETCELAMDALRRIRDEKRATA